MCTNYKKPIMMFFILHIWGNTSINEHVNTNVQPLLFSVLCVYLYNFIQVHKLQQYNGNLHKSKISLLKTRQLKSLIHVIVICFQFHLFLSKCIYTDTEMENQVFSLTFFYHLINTELSSNDVQWQILMMIIFWSFDRVHK